MKIRNGFVSNSSSSSFVMLMSKDVYDGLLEDLNPLEQAIVDHFSSNTRFLETDCIVYQHTSGNYSNFEYISQEECIQKAKEISEATGKEFDESDWSEDILYEFESSARKIRDKIFMHSEEF